MEPDKRIAMTGKRRTNREMTLGNINLSKPSDRTKLKSMVVELALQSQALTKKDIKSWRTAWQQAINIENPHRGPLLTIYTDAMIDLHLGGCIGQRKGMVMKKSFKLVDIKGNEEPDATQLMEAVWFKDFMDYVLDSRYYGHSLIQLGDVVERNGKIQYDRVLLVPRHHVVPEHGVILKEASDEWQKGIDYRTGAMADWCVEAGKWDDLGLLLKLVPQTISKKNMLAFWDQFGELFGMPIRVGKTTTRDAKERSKIENMLNEMGAAAWGLFPEGTEIDIKESSRGDAFNVYDKRVERANSEISKGVLNQTMTIDSGSSLSQSQTHLQVFQNVVDRDADFLRDTINGELLPRMLKHGFPVKGLRFDWDESIDYTPEQQVAYETMIADRFEVEPEYFIEKYNIPIKGKKASLVPGQMPQAKPFFD